MFHSTKMCLPCAKFTHFSMEQSNTHFRRYYRNHGSDFPQNLQSPMDDGPRCKAKKYHKKNLNKYEHLMPLILGPILIFIPTSE